MNLGDSIVTQFRLLQEIWFPALWNLGNDLFLVLATIEVGVAALLWVVQQQGADSIGAGLLKKFMVLGFFTPFSSTQTRGSRRSFAASWSRDNRPPTSKP